MFSILQKKIFQFYHMIVGSPDAYVSIELLAVHWKYCR